MTEKTLGNTEVSDAGGYEPYIKAVIKNSEAVEVPGGCMVQVSIQQKNPDGCFSITEEALTFIPGAKVVDDGSGGRKHVAVWDISDSGKPQVHRGSK